MAEGTNPRQFLYYLIILAISVVFVLEWGPGSRGCEVPWKEKAVNSAAMVNGHEIALREFGRQYAGALQNLRMQQNIPESLAKQMGFPKQVLDYMVDHELLAQAAERHGVTASDKELLDVLYKRVDFQKEGVFDAERYREVLRDYYRTSDTEFETKLRRDLSAEKMADLVESAAAVSDDEVKARFMKEGNKAQLSYVRFLPSMFAKKVPEPTESVIGQFEKDHAKEVSDYFEANKAIYHQPERIHARQILIKVDPDATAEQKATAKQRIEGVKKELDAGKDFAELAKQTSEDLGSKERGGDLGYVDRSALAPSVATAAFALSPGQVSAPVESAFGWHVVKVEDKKPAEDKQLSDVQHDIAKVLYVKTESKKLAEAEANKALADLQAGKKLATLYPPEATDKEKNPMFAFDVEDKPAANESGEINSTTTMLPKLGPAPQILTDTFALDAPAALKKVYSTGDGFAVVDVTSRSKPSDADFSAQRDSLRDEAIRAKRIELRESFLRSLRKSGTIVTNETAIDQVTGSSSAG